MKMVKCKKCGAQWPKGTKVCSNCGWQIPKPLGMRIVGWVVVVIVILILLVALFGESSDTDTGDTSNDNNSVSDGATNTDGENQSEEENKPEEIIEYSVYTVDEMVDELNDNALRAENTWNNQYVEITGRLSVIDSDGGYISLNPQNDEWALTGVQCDIKTEEQLNQVMEMSIGDIVTVRGKITSVGEILGFFLDIDEIL